MLGPESKKYLISVKIKEIYNFCSKIQEISNLYLKNQEFVNFSSKNKILPARLNSFEANCEIWKKFIENWERDEKE